MPYLRFGDNNYANVCGPTSRRYFLRTHSETISSPRRSSRIPSIPRPPTYRTQDLSEEQKTYDEQLREYHSNLVNFQERLAREHEWRTQELNVREELVRQREISVAASEGTFENWRTELNLREAHIRSREEILRDSGLRIQELLAELTDERHFVSVLSNANIPTNRRIFNGPPPNEEQVRIEDIQDIE